jgi:hypothetical protein
MDLELGKIWIAAGGFLIGAVAGAWIWAQRAAAIAAQVAQKAGEDALLEQARSAGTGALAAALQGAAVGGIIGLILAAVYLYFSDPDRGMKMNRFKAKDEY